MIVRSLSFVGLGLLLLLAWTLPRKHNDSEIIFGNRYKRRGHRERGGPQRKEWSRWRRRIAGQVLLLLLSMLSLPPLRYMKVSKREMPWCERSAPPVPHAIFYRNV